MPFESVHPVIREPIKSIIDEQSYDNRLYVVFFDCQHNGYVYKNLSKVVDDKRFVTKSYTIAELDKMKWVITFSPQ